MIPSIRVLVLLVLFIFLIFGEAISPIEAQGELSSLEATVDFLQPHYSAAKVRYMTATSYTSLEELTDSTPYLTAFMTPTRDGIAASNCLSFKTKIRLPTIFGNRVFEIEDKMNKRFSGENCRVDIWFPTLWEAERFGIRYNTPIEILE